jgi:CelD/BcsL family acetyltransferase involved in cellulose biosynthesis
MTSLGGRILDVLHVSGADEEAWRDLARRAIEPNPFFEPDCVIPAAIHQTFGQEIRLAVAEENGRFYACVPFRAVHHWKFPYPIVTSQIRRMGNLGTALVDAERGVEAMKTVLAVLAEHRRIDRGRIFAWDTASGDGPVADFVRVAARELNFPVSVLESYERGMLHRRSEPTYALDYSAKSRYNLRRQRRLLEEAAGGDVTVIDRSSDASAIDEYIELEASGYKREIGVAMKTVAGEREYFADMCRRFAGAGRLVLLALDVSGRTVAMELLIRGGEGLILYKTSYDENYARYGPGVLLHVAGIQYFHDRTDARWIDSATSPGNLLPLRLYKERKPIELLFVVLGRNVIDRAVVRAFLIARPIHKKLYHLRHRNSLPHGTTAGDLLGQYSDDLA